MYQAQTTRPILATPWGRCGHPCMTISTQSANTFSKVDQETFGNSHLKLLDRVVLEVCKSE
ncbi:hypothetical protein Hanom_Chr05g00423991 [Helianthus anomalus]